ncbi:hypothetical protein Fmac_000334 [Flemingia macrophylla]|uniref:Transcription repressor n=1 Tax=Flemingia macrophylla TaxID=520843 RepID=A0ABD1NE02_9FABA
MMGKRLKLKFNIPSFQICRSKDVSSLPGNPVPIPAIYRLSPVNPNALPSPSPSKITSIAQGCKMCRLKDNSTSVKSRGRKSTSSVPSRRSDYLIDNIEEEESETLISCMTSLSDGDFTGNSSRRRLKKVERVRLQGRGVEATTARLKKTARESFAVVKKSKDPYQDFKKSMMEMISEMEMSEAQDLEQLLQCFLALNSRSYHAVIVRAFMEICQQMFVWNPTTTVKNIQTDLKTNV